MNIQVVLSIMGSLSVILGATMISALGFAVYDHGPDTGVLAMSIAICVVLGCALRFAFRNHRHDAMRHKEGFAVVALGWIFLAGLGALPFYLYETPQFPTYIDCYFEAMSGFTTTGASVLTDIEALPRGILFWRSLTHWLGGMGIIVLTLAILPMLGVGGMQLFKAEVPGPTSERFLPRIGQTAKVLWGVYLLLSAVETVLLMFGGMNLFDALCHTFGTMATGGFSTKNTSIAHFNSVYIEVVIIVFMFLAGTNFALHFRALTGNLKCFWRDMEFRTYTCIVIVIIGVLTIANFAPVTALIEDNDLNYDSIGTSLRTASFQALSIMTTTGFVTADFDQWPHLCRFLLLALMFLGACAGSTGGGMKVVRFMLIFKKAKREIRRLIYPSGVFSIKIGGKAVDEDVVSGVTGFFILYMCIFALGTAFMAVLGLNLTSAIASIAATLGNIGPGLGSVGAVRNYAHIPLVGKAFLSLMMLLGRLEIYTVIILLVPEFWRK
ncbi:TrkH family potassium uptake protein [Candidatus Hydrogenedentota bacterium]